MNFHPQESIALFIDGPNFHSSARVLGFAIDYRKLLELFGFQGRLVEGFLTVRDLLTVRASGRIRGGSICCGQLEIERGGAVTGNFRPLPEVAE